MIVITFEINVMFYSCMTVPSWGISEYSSFESSENSDEGSVSLSENENESKSSEDEGEGESSEDEGSESESVHKEIILEKMENNDDPHLGNLYAMFPSTDKSVINDMYQVWGRNAERTSLLLLEQGAGENQNQPEAHQTETVQPTVPTAA